MDIAGKKKIQRVHGHRHKASMESSGSEYNSINLAVISSNLRHRGQIQNVLERHGLNVVINEPLSRILLDKLPSMKADVILLDADDHTCEQEDLLDALLDNMDVPIIFNDVSDQTLAEPLLTAKWYGKLINKITDLTGREDCDELDIDLAWAANIDAMANVRVSRESLAENIWVLGASLGGPEALKQFLSLLPKDLPVAFILAQHLGSRFMSMLAEQLDRITPFQVVKARVGHVLKHQEVMVVPVNARLKVSPIGAIELHHLDIESTYSPSIDTVLIDMAQRYAERCNTIIFSGMCDDGMCGAQVVAHVGGQVWTQDADSCVISAMPDSVRKTGCSQFEGTPRQLAARLIQYYR